VPPDRFRHWLASRFPEELRCMKTPSTAVPLVSLKPEYAELYKGKLEVGRDYHGLFSNFHPDYMSIMGTTVDRADKRHFDIQDVEGAEEAR
jgi:hypothetical protein